MSTLVADIKAAFSVGDFSKVVDSISQIRLLLGQTDEIGVRELNEMAAISSLSLNDMTSFENHAILIRSAIASESTVPSERSLIITGLYLIYLLVCDRIGDFHTEIELLPAEILSDRLISYSIHLERSMMEGNYAKVLGDVQPPEYAVFVSRLGDSVRVKAQEVLTSASQRKTRNPVDFKSESIAKIGRLVSYAVDIERIV